MIIFYNENKTKHIAHSEQYTITYIHIMLVTWIAKMFRVRYVFRFILIVKKYLFCFLRSEFIILLQFIFVKRAKDLVHAVEV